MNKSQRMRTPRGVSTQRRMSQKMRPLRPVSTQRRMSQRMRQPRGVFQNVNNNFEPVRQRRKTFTRKSTQSKGRKTRMTPIQSVNN